MPFHSRRYAIFLFGFAAAAVSLPAAGAPKPATSIHQEVDFSAPPSRIYAALLDSKQFSAITSLAASIQPGPGGALNLFGGLILGRNIELVPNRRIVQAWREDSWRPGHYSLIHFELVPKDGGTHLVFDQTGVDEADWSHLNEGWPKRYWTPLRQYLQQSK